MKKFYESPSASVMELEAEGILAGSTITANPGDTGEGGDISFESNKKGWDSESWNTEE